MGKLLIATIVFLVAIVAGFYLFGYFYLTQTTYSGVYITGHMVDVDSEGSHYLLMTILPSGVHQVFEINRPWFMSLDSTTNPDIIYMQVQVNQTYTLYTYGWNIQVLSIYWYPLVYKIV
jgi:hypothetical protein